MLRVLGLDQLDRFVSNQRGEVLFFPEETAVALPVDQASVLGEIIDLAHKVTVKVVEAAILRPVLPVGVAEMPLADHVGLVAGVLEGLGSVRSSVGKP